MSSILLIEKDPSLADYLRKELEERGYQVWLKDGISGGLELVADQFPELVVLDVEAPDLTCRSACRQFREEVPQLPILLIIPEEGSEDFPDYYQLGADDFVTRPIDLAAFLSRIKVLLTDRTPEGETEVLRAGNLEMNLRTHTVTRGGRSIDLTPREFELLRFFLKNSNRVLTRDLILSRVWSYDADIDSRAVDVYVGYLRDKITRNDEDKMIQTVRGFGYLLQE